MTFDLAIVGGGPAGAAAAIEARRLGLSVTLHERGRFPRDKVCGEFISGESVELLKRVIPEVAARGIAIRKGAFISPRGRSRIFPLPEPALGLSRLALDQALWSDAISVGAKCRAGVAVKEVSRPKPATVGSAVWRIESADGTTTESRNLILACGRWWAIEGLPSPASAAGAAASPWVGLKAHFSGVATSEAVEMFYFPGGYCGLAPVEGGATNVCCLVHRDLVKRAGAAGVSDFRRWLARAAGSSALESRLNGARQITETVAAAPLNLVRRAPAAGGAILAGDASGFIDPFTGDGISIALQSGTLAAQVVAQAHSSGYETEKEAASEYARRLRRAVARSHSMAGFLRQLVRAPASAQELGALALPLVGPALVRATRFRAFTSTASGETAG